MNEENKNEGLNTISLGGVESSPNNLNMPLNEIGQEIESLDVGVEAPTAAPMSSDAQPFDSVPPVDNNVNNVSSTETVPTVAPVEPVAPVAPINYDVPESINNFSPMFNDIGTVPPIPDAPIVENQVPEIKTKKKKGLNKVLFVLIIIIALAAVGGGVYYFLHYANEANKPKVKVKLVELEINSEVSTTITDYATFDGISSSSCSLDTSNVTDTSKLNQEYTYTINCEGTSYSGKLKIVDTTNPEVVVKEKVTVSVDGELVPEDFIEECEDATECTYKFKDVDKVKNHLKEANNYKVDIIISDEAGNSVEKTGNLVVSTTFVEADLYLICSKKGNAYTTNNKFGLTEDNDGYTFNENTLRTYTFTFTDETQYNTFKEENSDKDEISYNGVTGKPEFNDDSLSLNLVKVMSYAELNEEEKTTLPLPYSELKNYYEKKGFSCSPGY